MDNAKAKRNVIAILVGLSVIMLAAFLTRPKDSYNPWVDLWGLLAKHKQPIFAGGAGSETQVRIASLTGDWFFSTGDNADWAKEGFDHSDWDKLHVPSYWERQGYGEYNGFAWYRREFEVDRQALNRSLNVVLGRIDDTDEVYVNGERIGGLGQFPPTYVSAWNRYRDYAIPPALVHEGTNVIAVRVYDAQMGGGITDSNIGIYASRLPRPLLDLRGEWLFRTGDETEWKDGNVDESGFQTVDVPSIWENQGHAHYDGYAWYRKRFPGLDVADEEKLILLLGKIDDTDEVFLNGERIGRTGRLNSSDRKDNPDYYALDRAYEFSPSLLKESNVLSVRVHDSGGEGGIYAGPVGIVTKASYMEYRQQPSK